MSLAYSIGTHSNPYTYWYNYIVTRSTFSISGVPSGSIVAGLGDLRTSAPNLVVSTYSTGGTYSKSVTGTGPDGNTINLSLSSSYTSGCGYTTSGSAKPISLEIATELTGYKSGFLVSTTQAHLGATWTGATWQDGPVISVPIGSGSNQACLVVPMFVPLASYTLTVKAGAGGTVSGGGTYYEGDTATLTATPSDGYSFVKWSDGVTTATRSVVVKGDATYTATFAVKTYVVSYKKGSYGTGTESSVTKTHGVAIVLPGATFTRTDYLQSGWSKVATGTSKAYDLGASYTANAAATLYPYWVATSYALTLSSSNETYGTVSGGGTYGHGRTATATATPNLRIATFSKWSDGSTSATRTITMTSDVSLTATFTAKSVSTTYGVQNSSGAGGYVAIGSSGTHVTSTSTTSVAYGQTRNFVTGCGSGYKFKRWVVYYKALSEAGAVSGDEMSCCPDWASSFTWTAGPVDVSGDAVTTSPTGAYQVTKIMAEFEARTYEVTASVAKTGSAYGRWDSAVTPGVVSGAGSYSYGTTCSLSVTAASGYRFARWDDGSTSNPLTVAVSADVARTAYFTGVTKTITLVATSTGRGTLAFSDGGSASREYGTVAKLKATPASHYRFSRWTDGVTNAERSVNVVADTSFEAEFVTDDVVTILTGVDPVGGGAVSGGGEVAYDSSVTLTATPASGWEFVSWQDGATAATRTVTADDATAAVTYVATFRRKAYQVTLAGTNCAVAATVVSGAESSSGVYEYGAVLSLAVTPAAHYHFSQWSDGDASNPRVVTVTATASYLATAVVDVHAVVASAGDGGSVSVTKVSGAGSGSSWEYGSVLELAATADEQHEFVKWSDGATDAVRRVTVTGDASYFAQFQTKTYTVTVASGGGGTASIDGASGQSATFAYGTSVTIRATAVDHYGFSQWSDGTKDNPKTFAVSGNHSFTASFVADRHAITVTAGTGGSATGGGQYDYGSMAKLVATPVYTDDSRYVFAGWYDAAGIRVAATTTYEPVVEGDASYEARFAPLTHEVSVTVSGDGTAEGAGTYVYNSAATLVATANAHSHFVKWTKDGEDYSESATVSLTVTADVAFTAVFAKDVHTITTKVVDAGTGTVTAGGAYEYGSLFTATATPAAGYFFSGWYKDGVATGATDPMLVTEVTGDATYSAKFEVGQYDVTASVVPANCGCSVVGTGTYNKGVSCTLTAADAGAYEFDRWSDGVTTRTRTFAVEGTASFTAVFKIRRHVLTVRSNDTSMGTASGGGTFDYTETESILVEAKAISGYRFLGWRKGESMSVVSTATRMYVSLTEDTTYTAVFAARTYVVTVVSYGGGTVEGVGEYEEGASVPLTPVPDDGYMFARWLDGSVASPRTVSVTGDVTLHAVFSYRKSSRGRVLAARWSAG